MKRILVIVAAAVGALVLAKKSSDQQAERELRAEATDELSHN